LADLTQMQAKIRELEARRAKGESVPELDRLYDKMDTMQNKGYEDTKKNLSGEELVNTKPASTPVIKKAKGGSASSRADGCAMRGKTRGKMY
jgi:hypothetical protein